MSKLADEQISQYADEKQCAFIFFHWLISTFSNWLIPFFLLISSFAFAQDKDLIQFSGVVLERDSLVPVAFTRIMIKNSHRGTIADYNGYFSFVAQKKDTLVFSSTGYKKSIYAISDTLTGNKYSLIQVLSSDTTNLPVTVIYPWPSPDEFKKIFLSKNIPNDDLTRAKNNLAQEAMKERFQTMPMDGSMNYKNQMAQQSSRLYWAGQYPPNNLLNPIAWAQFIKAWRDGQFKAKPKTDSEQEDK